MLKINICVTFTGQICELILFHNFTARNPGDMENKSVDHLWSTYKPLFFLNGFFRCVFLKDKPGRIVKLALIPKYPLLQVQKRSVTGAGKLFKFERPLSLS